MRNFKSLPACLFVIASAAFQFFCLGTGRAEAQDSTAVFELALEITWSAETTPLDFPEEAHLSGLIGATHNKRYVLFRDGQTASSGLELVAENGRVKTLRAEFAEAQRRKRLGTMIDGPDLAQVPGRLAVRFETTPEHPFLSFISMLAPSPDWFIGADKIPLTKEGAWIDAVEFPLWAWDSGTDSGGTYSAKDQDLQPQESIRLVATPHFLTSNGLVSLGTAKLRRLQP